MWGAFLRRFRQPRLVKCRNGTGFRVSFLSFVAFDRSFQQVHSPTRGCRMPFLLPFTIPTSPRGLSIASKCFKNCGGHRSCGSRFSFAALKMKIVSIRRHSLRRSFALLQQRLGTVVSRHFGYCILFFRDVGGISKVVFTIPISIAGRAIGFGTIPLLLICFPARHQLPPFFVTSPHPL